MKARIIHPWLATFVVCGVVSTLTAAEPAVDVGTALKKMLVPLAGAVGAAPEGTANAARPMAGLKAAPAVAPQPTPLGALPITLTELYYPMHSSDWKTMEGYGGGVSVSTDHSFGWDSYNHWFNEYHDDWASGYGSVYSRYYLQYSGDDVLWYGLYNGGSGITLDFDTPLVFVKGSALPKGGSWKSTTTTWFYYYGDWYLVTVTISFKLSVVSGPVSTGCTIYDDCRSLDGTITVSAEGESVKLSFDGPILAPGVGRISQKFYETTSSGSLRYVATATLTGGSIGGEPACDIHIETKPPTLAFTSPSSSGSGQRWSNAVFVVNGTTKDNVGVTNVLYQLNGGPWTKAQTGNNWSNWTATITMEDAGTNTVRAYAMDASGNCSTTNSAKIIYVQSDLLQVSMSGPGTLTPNYSNALLQISSTYTMTAKPGAGYVVSNWVNGSGVVLTNGAAVRFQMASNLWLHANITPNPFIPAQGNYNGLFYNSNGVLHESSGFFTLKLTDRGKYSASLLLGGKRISLSGTLDVSGATSQVILRSKTNWLTVEMMVNLTPDADLLTGTISDGVWTANLMADRAVFDTKIRPAADYAGKYTMVVQRTNDDNTLPEGDGYGVVSVDLAGKVKLSGALADGARLSQNTMISKDGQWPFYASLYGNKGSTLGWIGFTNLEAMVSWIKPANPKDKYYGAGFTNDQFITKGSRYIQPAKTNQVIELTDGTNGVVTFSGGNLAPFTNLVTLIAGNKVLNGSSNKLTLTITPASGAFSGSVTAPGNTRSTPIKGVLLQNQNQGSGYFLGTNQSGRVWLGPR